MWPTSNPFLSLYKLGQKLSGSVAFHIRSQYSSESVINPQQKEYTIDNTPSDGIKEYNRTLKINKLK